MAVAVVMAPNNVAAIINLETKALKVTEMIAVETTVITTVVTLKMVVVVTTEMAVARTTVGTTVTTAAAVMARTSSRTPVVAAEVSTLEAEAVFEVTAARDMALVADMVVALSLTCTGKSSHIVHVNGI
jgi:hypothetical protein